MPFIISSSNMDLKETFHFLEISIIDWSKTLFRDCIFMYTEWHLISRQVLLSYQGSGKHALLLPRLLLFPASGYFDCTKRVKRWWLSGVPLVNNLSDTQHLLEHFWGFQGHAGLCLLLWFIKYIPASRSPQFNAKWLASTSTNWSKPHIISKWNPRSQIIFCLTLPRKTLISYTGW